MFNYNTDTDHNESIFPDIVQYQVITEADVVLELIGTPVILDRHVSDIDTLMQRTVDVAALCWANPYNGTDVLEHIPIQFKSNVESEIEYELPLNCFMHFLIFIRPVINYVNEINIEDFMFDPPLIEKRRDEIINNMRQVLIAFGHTMEEVYEHVRDILKYMSELNRIFAQARIQVFTAENLFLDHYRACEEIREINNTRYPSNTQTSEIIEHNAELYKRLHDIMIERNNPLFIDNKFTKILKPKQIEELFIHLGMIPDGKNLINIIMDGNGFNDGYKNLDVLYAAAIAARVPELMNLEYMGPAGYFARNLWILAYGTISHKVYDCGSKNPIPITVDESALKMFTGRYYHMSKNDGVRRILKPSDKHLIGKTLWFRSPCTCNLNTDVCHVCYGNTALRVKDFNGGFVCTTQMMSGRINQNVLSAKHLLRADAEPIVFTTNFEKYFEFDASQIIIKDTGDDEKKFDIYIREDYMDDITEKFEVFIGKNLEAVTISNYANININKQLLNKMKSVTIDDIVYYKINSSKVEDEICALTPINKLMTEKYIKMMHLLENNISKYENVSDVVTELYHLYDGTIPLLSTHGEIIIRCLLRNPDNLMKRPNWLNYDEPYAMVRVKTALSNTDSFTAAVASEQTSHHIRHAVFDERNRINKIGARNFIDFFFGYTRQGVSLESIFQKMKEDGWE